MTKNGHIGNMFGEFQGFSHTFLCQEIKSGYYAIAIKIDLDLRDVSKEE